MHTTPCAPHLINRVTNLFYKSNTIKLATTLMPTKCTIYSPPTCHTKPTGNGWMTCGKWQARLQELHQKAILGGNI